MIIFIVTFLLSFAICNILTKYLIDYFKNNDIVAFDLHKKNKPLLPNSGGICVVLSLILGLMLFIGFKTFFLNDQSKLLDLFAAILTILLISIVGFFDDLNSSNILKGKDKIRKGLKQWQKPLLTLFAAIPLMAVKAGYSTLTLPIIGSVNFGILYPLILVPLGVVFVANSVNMLGGFNGVEAGMGLVYTLSLGLFALEHNETVSAVIFFSAAGALLAFLKYNWIPAKILPGDSLTYGLGSVVASGVIIGNMEKAGMIVMMPFILEFLFKLRSKFKAQCLGKLKNDAILEAPYGRQIYSWTHIIMNLGKLKEKQVTRLLILIESLFCSLIFILF